MFVYRRSAAEPVRAEHKVDSFQDCGFAGVVIADQYNVIREEQISGFYAPEVPYLQSADFQGDFPSRKR